MNEEITYPKYHPDQWVLFKHPVHGSQHMTKIQGGSLHQEKGWIYKMDETLAKSIGMEPKVAETGIIASLVNGRWNPANTGVRIEDVVDDEDEGGIVTYDGPPPHY